MPIEQQSKQEWRLHNYAIAWDYSLILSWPCAKLLVLAAPAYAAYSYSSILSLRWSICWQWQKNMWRTAKVVVGMSALDSLSYWTLGIDKVG